MNIGNLIISPTGAWLAAFAVFLIIELFTFGLTTIWFAGGALIAALVALIGAGPIVQIIVFVVISIVLLICTRPVAVKYLNRSRTKTNADSLVGQTGIVTATICNIKAEGTVMVNGQEWTARSEDDAIEIEKDSRVQIVGIQGVKLIVKKEAEA